MTQLASPPPSAFRAQRTARPMLARDADSVYWMSRYVERAEHVARMLLVNANLLIDVGDLAPGLLEQQWHSVYTVFRMEVPEELADAPRDESLGGRVARHMAFNP